MPIKIECVLACANHQPRTRLNDGKCNRRGRFFADSFQGAIWAYDDDITTGTPSNKRVFASFKEDRGVADGSTVDAEGCMWNAQVISGDLVRYTL